MCNSIGIGTGFMPMAVSPAAHSDRVKQIYRKTVKSIATSAGPKGASIIESLDSIFDNLDKKDEELTDQSKIRMMINLICKFIL